MRFKTLVILCLFSIASVAAMAQGSTAVATEGGMYFALNGSISNALTANGISLGTTGYNNTGTGYPGFPLVGGSLDVDNGNGITQFDGSIDFQSGNQILQLKDLSYVNVGTTPFLSAAIYENGLFLYRQIIFLVISGNGFGPLPLGPIHTNNVYFSFNPMFVSAFQTFFQAPQLAIAFAPNPNYGATGFFGVQAEIQNAPALPTQPAGN